MTVKVEVNFLAQIAEEIGARNLVIDTLDTLPDALKEIERVTGFPLETKLESGNYGILVNGRSYRLVQREKLTLKEGDKIAILPTLGGG